ncbi:MAG: 6-carboxytetrahydropterin synthase QueD [Candidatus Altiarchaeota archaeon]|nr:6-carboxytetrahydropterin synthase QueD [Candidatus Altiarchaeota archaeon]
MKVGRVFYFDAAHYLPDYKGKCERLHGHTYKLEVVVRGDMGADGMLMDFSELKEVVNSGILELLDHSNLNDLFENPTVETIASWILNELKKKTPVYSVKLWEGHGKWVEVCSD